MQFCRATIVAKLLTKSILLASLAGCGHSSLTDTEYLAQAKEYQQEGEFRAAVISLRNAVQRNPQNAEAHFLLGVLQQDAGNVGNAEKELRLARELGYPRDQLELRLARVLLLQGKFKELLVEIRADAVENPAAKAELMALHGEAYIGERQFDQAGAQFEAAEKMSPGLVDVAVGRIKLAIVNGNHEEAEQRLDSLLTSGQQRKDILLLKAGLAFRDSRLDEAREAYLKASIVSGKQRMDRETIDANIGLIRIALIKGELDEANKYIGAIKEAAPNHVLSQYFEALLAFSNEEYASARDLLLLVLKSHPKHLPSQLLLGSAYYALGNYGQADSYLSSFVAEVPDHIQARKLLSATRMRLDRPEDALDLLGSAIKSNPEDVQLLSIISQAAIQMGDFAAGKKYIERASEIAPDEQSIRFELARVLVAQGDIDSAITELERDAAQGDIRSKLLLVQALTSKREFVRAREIASELVNVNGGNAKFKVLLGSIDRMAGNRDSARKYFSEAVEADPSLGLAQVILAQMDMEDGRKDQAEARYKKVIETHADDVAAMLGLAQISESRGKTQEAVAWIEKARASDQSALMPRLLLGSYYLRTGDNQHVISVVQEALRHYPRDIRALRLLAQAQAKSQRNDDAVATYRKIIEIDPESVAAHMGLAEIYYKQKHYAASDESFKTALTLDPDNYQAKLGIALVAFEAGNADMAFELARAIQKDEKSAPLGYALEGELSMRKSRFAEAVNAFEEAFRRNPSQDLAEQLSRAYIQAGNAASAVGVLEKLLERVGSERRLEMQLAEAWQHAGNASKAETIYLAIIDQDPEYVPAINNLAYLYLDLNPKRAREFAEHAHRLAPDDPAILDTLGWVHVRQGDFAGGAEFLRKAASLSDEPAIHYHFAVALIQTGAKEEARTALARALDSGRRFEELDDARKLLSSL